MSEANKLFDRIKARWDRDNPFPLTHENLVALCITGSDSHGTKLHATDPNAVDDLDLIAVVMPPVGYALGTRTWEGTSFWEGELDFVAYSFAKFVRLLVKANPNVLGLLWLQPQHYLHTSSVWDSLVAQRQLFSTLEAYHSFAGYANGQLKRMTSFDLSTSNRWDECVRVVEAMGWTVDQVTSRAPREMPGNLGERLDAVAFAFPHIDVGSPYAAGRPASWTDTDRMYVMRVVNQHAEELQRLHARHFQGYMGAKRKALVVKHGYDCKNAAHLLRLLATCRDYLITGRVQVWRGPRFAEGTDTMLATGDAGYFADVKCGRYDLATVRTRADELFARVKELAEGNPANLPAQPDLDAIDALVCGLQLDAYR